MRDEANANWITLGTLDQVAKTFSVPALTGVTASAAELNILDGVTATTAELNQLDTNIFVSPVAFPDGTAAAPSITNTGNTDTGVFFPAADTVAVATGGSERLRVDSSGNFGVGTANPLSKFQVSDVTQNLQMRIGETSAGLSPSVRFQGRNTIDSNNRFADIKLNSDNNLFTIMAPAASSPTIDALSIDSSGNLLVAKTATGASTVGIEAKASGLFRATRSGGECIEINRVASDGTLVIFRQAGNTEGTISVSGSTVSYNGGHLSRWAQFPDNSRPELLKGTVMSNLDQMSNWDGEDNEQLNCVQVSAVEGDANVAGVFVAWDTTEDDYNDILLAMTGDMVIRIAGGTTVQRGDLLMSAGDGTAKPQGDDIVRSKTIAKVTSTHISHTYADGSYAVPCVLMAC
jgi:hypothetical protein